MRLVDIDKQLHIWISFILTILSYYILEKLDIEGLFVGYYLLGNLGVAALIAVIIGGLKEIIWDDMLNYGTSDKFDMLANTLGIVFGMISVLIFELVKG